MLVFPCVPSVLIGPLPAFRVFGSRTVCVEEVWAVSSSARQSRQPGEAGERSFWNGRNKTQKNCHTPTGDWHWSQIREGSGLPQCLSGKNPPATQGLQETGIWSVGREDPLEEGMATHSSILAWRIPWTEESRGLQSVGSQRVEHDGSNLVCTGNQRLLLLLSR